MNPPVGVVCPDRLGLILRSARVYQVDYAHFKRLKSITSTSN